MHRFDVFGRRIGVTRVGDEWRAVLLGEEGKHSVARGVVVETAGSSPRVGQ